MLNFMDTWTVDKLVEARREEYLRPARQRSRIQASVQPESVCIHPRAGGILGYRLVRAGARISGLDVKQLCVRQPDMEGVCIPI